MTLKTIRLAERACRQAERLEELIEVLRQNLVQLAYHLDYPEEAHEQTKKLAHVLMLLNIASSELTDVRVEVAHGSWD